MIEAYKHDIEWAQKNEKAIKKHAAKLKKMRKGQVDRLIHPLHDAAFDQIECLHCANCCRTTGPRFTRQDIDRIANHLQLSAQQFADTYLRIDEDHDFVLKKVPCAFLDEDNYCTIYEVRPKACREYPHTDRVNQLGILSLSVKNSLICPAVAKIFQNLDLLNLG